MSEETKKTYIPDSLKPYAHLLVNTGGNDPEDLLRMLYEDKNVMSTNPLLATMALSIESQLTLLSNLKEKDLLRDVDSSTKE